MACSPKRAETVPGGEQDARVVENIKAISDNILPADLLQARAAVASRVYEVRPMVIILVKTEMTLKLRFLLAKYSIALCRAHFPLSPQCPVPVRYPRPPPGVCGEE